MSAHKRVKMFCSDSGLKILFLLASSREASSLFPAPLIYLEMFSKSFAEGEAVKIFCVAPRDYIGAYFHLFVVGQNQQVQTLSARENQHQVTFLLENVTTSDTGLYRCQYGLLNGSQLQPSALSNTVEITVHTFSPSTSLPTLISAFSLSTFPTMSAPASDCQGTMLHTRHVVMWTRVPALLLVSLIGFLSRARSHSV